MQFFCLLVGLLGVASFDVADLLKTKGFAHFSFGPKASVAQLERAARELLNVTADYDAAKAYNGLGGMDRKNLDGTTLVDLKAGAPANMYQVLHNEMGYSAKFPSNIAFIMLKQAPKGGITLLADQLKALRILERDHPALLRKMRDLGVLYTRNLHDVADIDAPDYYLSWQGAFRTMDMDEAIAIAESRGEKLQQHKDERRLIHTWKRSVFHTHPEHGEMLVHSLLGRHGAWFDSHPVISTHMMHERPLHSQWGNGEEFSQIELDTLWGVYHEIMTEMRLAPGDVMLVDNIRMQHGRTDYQGERVIAFMMDALEDRTEWSAHSPSRAPFSASE